MAAKPNKLVMAAKAGRLERLRELISEGHPLDGAGSDGCTALLSAAANMSEACAIALVGAGAGLEKGHPKTGTNPLHHAIGRNLDALAEALIAAGADPRAVDRSGPGPVTALQWALMRGKDELAKMMVAGLSDPGKPDFLHRTPLCLAAETGCAETVKMLTALGVDPDKAHLVGQTPMSLAAISLAAASGSAECVEALALAGADPNIRGFNDLTPLHQATNAAAAALLVGAGARLEDKMGIQGMGTALHNAVLQDRPDVVEFLAMAGADPDATDREGATPLHYAARYGRADMCPVLVGAGADPERRNSRGETPADAATGGAKGFFAALSESEALRAATAAASKTGQAPAPARSRRL